MAFQDDLARTPLDILKFIRINKAMQLLRDTECKVHVIAAECGFGLVPNLYHHFRQSAGLTPTEYRKQSRA